MLKIKNCYNHLERVLFKHKNSEIFLLADAYDGKCIKEAMTHFLEASAGNNPQEITIDDRKLPFGRNSNLVNYIGHNGLMEFDVDAILIQRTTTSKMQSYPPASVKIIFSLI